jgi:transglutaminase-like putative cysteine protease
VTGRQRFGRYDLLLVALAATSTGAFAWARSGSQGWTPLGLVPVAAALPLGPVPARVRRAVEKSGWILFAVILAWVFWWLVSTEGQGQPSPPIPVLLVYSAPLLLVLFLAGRHVWDPARTLIPACLVTVVLAVSRSQIERPMTLPIATVFLAAAGFLLGTDAPSPGRRQRIVRFLVFVLCGVLVAVGITVGLRRAQPWVLQLASQAAFGDAETGFSPETRLGSVQQLELSDRVVMRVWTERPEKLRAWVGTRFDGRTWTALQGRGQVLPPAAGGAQDAQAWPEGVDGSIYALSAAGSPDAQVGSPNAYSIRTVESVPGTIPTPAHVHLIRLPARTLTLDSLGLLHPALEAGTLYSVRDGLIVATSDPNDADLALPPETDPRLRTLAARLAAGVTTNERRVEATVGWLQANVRYSLHVGRFASTQPVAEFLFEKRQGWCEYFASAAAVLLRLQGVPTRYVKGFNVRHRLKRGGHYVVRQADAHAWIDVWMPDRGWVECDPTPPGQFDAAHGEPAGGLWGDLYERLTTVVEDLTAVHWAELPAQLVTYVGQHLRFAGAILAFVLIGLGLQRWITVYGLPRRAVRRPPRAPLEALLAQVDEEWATHRVPRPPSRAPLEHLSQIPPGLLPATSLEVERAVIDCYYRAHFGGQPATETEIAHLWAALQGVIDQTGR